MNPYAALGLVLLLGAAGFAGYSHGVKTTKDHYTAVIAKGAVDAAEVTRIAVEKARVAERIERDRQLGEANAAAVVARREAAAAKTKSLSLARKLEELSREDATVDAWRATALPEPVRMLVSPSNQDSPR